jgi:glycerol-3-phosphate dehydrogenase
MRANDVDVAIVGGGVVGASVAARLSSTTATVCLLEAAGDLAEGASKGNGGVTDTGFDATPGALETEMIVASSQRWESLCERLDVPFRRIGALVVANTEHDLQRLDELHRDAATNGVRTEVISSQRACAMEPLLNPECRGALWVPEEGIIDPMRLTIGYAELAARNGVEIRVRSPAVGFELDGGRVREVHTPTGNVRARFVVNAAGLFADAIDALAGADPCRMWPRRGQYWVLDRAFGSRLNHVIAPIPKPEARGVFVVPTTNGSALVGPTAEDREDRFDKSTDRESVDRLFTRAQELVPTVSPDYAIKSFAALRPASDDVYRLRVDSRIENLVHATGIRSTGVSSSPAVADRVFELLRAAGLEADERESALTAVPPTPHFGLEPEPTTLTSVDAAYGQIVCACEQVSAAEIAAALRMHVPARSIAGVRKRTRATGGRCQGSVCMAGVAFMCSLELGIAPQDVQLDDEVGTLGVGLASGLSE